MTVTRSTKDGERCRSCARRRHHHDRCRHDRQPARLRRHAYHRPGIMGDPPDRAEARRVLRRAVELGVDFIDTADSYGPRVSEELIAEALYPYPDGLVIATKGGLLRPGPGRWPPDGRPEHLRAGARGQPAGPAPRAYRSLPAPSPRSQGPLRGVGRRAGRAQAEGKIRHIGVSNVGRDQLRRGPAGDRRSSRCRTATTPSTGAPRPGRYLCP